MTEYNVSRIPLKFVLEKVGESIGELIRFKAPRTINMIERHLPVEGRAALLKDQVYFRIHVKIGKGR